MSDLVILAIGFIIGWNIMGEVNFWLDLRRTKVRLEAIRNEPSTFRVIDRETGLPMENIIWARKEPASEFDNGNWYSVRSDDAPRRRILKPVDGSILVTIAGETVE